MDFPGAEHRETLPAAFLNASLQRPVASTPLGGRNSREPSALPEWRAATHSNTWHGQVYRRKGEKVCLREHALAVTGRGLAKER